ncbi:hypothetical protein ABWK22_12115 [Gottfriedia acidiceleris]|uniref:hypothetical protein n=1 Tax=Gottfriedia acidiceleris TaxID=371036 RepID=UPI0033915FD9
MNIKEFIYITLPIFLTMIVSICIGIPKVLYFSLGCFFVSIFTVGIPIIVCCLPYWLYFLSHEKEFEKPKYYSYFATGGTLVLFVLFLIVSAHIYKPIENKFYFSKEILQTLSNQSLKTFEHDKHMKGKVTDIRYTSAMEGWNDVEESGLVDGRKLVIVVKSTSENKGLTVIYVYKTKHHKWVLIKQL